MGMHDGHRQRKREAYLKAGVDAFADHELLELLLYYAIPRRDTNPIAHALLDAFGSLQGVFTAKPEDLCKIAGITENAAVLLTAIIPLYQRAQLGTFKENPVLNSSAKLAAYFINLLNTLPVEKAYEMCLNAKGRMLCCVELDEGSTSSVNVSVRQVVERALRCNAAAVVLAHNHPNGSLVPSADDLALTRQLRDALEIVDVQLLDHFIIADGHYASLKKGGFLRSKEQLALNDA